MSGHRVADLDAVIEETLRAAELEYEHPGLGRFVVTLPGVKKTPISIGMRAATPFSRAMPARTGQLARLSSL